MANEGLTAAPPEARPSDHRSVPPVRLFAAGATVVLLWSSAFVAVTVALREVGPGQLALARYAVASVAFLGWLAVARPRLPPARDLVRLAVAGGVGIALYNVALNTGQQTVGPGVASLLINTVPIWTSLLSVAWLGERICRRRALGTALSFAGVTVIGLHRGGWGGFEPGVVAILAAAGSQALYFVILKPLLARYRAIELTAWAVWLGSLFLLPYQPGLLATLREIEPLTGWAIVFLGVGPAALGYAAWSYVLSAMPAGKATNLLFLVPVGTIGLGWSLLGDVPSPVALVGGLVSVTGVAMSQGLVGGRRATALDSRSTGESVPTCSGAGR